MGEGGSGEGRGGRREGRGGEEGGGGEEDEGGEVLQRLWWEMECGVRSWVGMGGICKELDGQEWALYSLSEWEGLFAVCTIDPGLDLGSQIAAHEAYLK